MPPTDWPPWVVMWTLATAVFAGCKWMTWARTQAPDVSAGRQVAYLFAWPGLGRLTYDSVQARDYPVLQGAVLFVAALFLLVNLVVDVLYARLDPRISVR